MGRDPGFTWKRISILPSIEYRAFYTDRLFNFQQAADKQDFLHYVSPRIALSREFRPAGWDVTVGASYTPTFIIYSFNGEFDRIDHLATAQISAARDERVLTLNHTYRRSSEITSELGFLVSQERHLTQLSYRQSLSEKLGLQASAQQTLIESTTGNQTTARSFSQWSGDGFLLYNWLPKVSTGLGVSVSYTDQDGLRGNFQTVSEQLLTRWLYAATEKLDVSLDAGVQLSQSLISGVRDIPATPVGRAAVQYSPRYGTTFTLSAARISRLSELQSGVSFTENRVTIGARQRVYQTMSAAINASYGEGTFEDTLIVGGAPDRSYNNYLVGLQYSWQPNPRWRFTGFYQFMRRTSDFVGDTYSNNQVGFVVNLAI